MIVINRKPKIKELIEFAKYKKFKKNKQQTWVLVSPRNKTRLQNILLHKHQLKTTVLMFASMFRMKS